ncbi:nucleotide-binding universal stress UspA family protein [Halarchaeum solikamskense]|uniref:universal stress protein n=1 Tax=Halarchaeum nitratireducens TaxID=489913 RepID=UPI001B3ACC66|nr:universal stress protein [Halarchaeum solikamskense]MBP2249884.1 nucleotide-binding universal stress UspA family protein [Halarchaeum solikamskense]
MYDTILLATDGTVASENAASHAIELAQAHGADLRVVYVVDESVYTAYSGDEYVDGAEGPEHGLEETGEAAIDAVRREAEAAGVDVTGELRHGDPAETVVAHADEVDADLLVLGTRQRPEEYRALLGSVTDRVLRLATRPAIVVKTEAEAEAGA